MASTQRPNDLDPTANNMDLESPTISKTQIVKKLSMPSSKSSTKPLARDHFPFLRLPAEIRNMIYKYALVDPEYAIAIDSTKDEGISRRLMTRGDVKAMHTDEEFERIMSTKVPKKMMIWRYQSRLCGQLLAVNRQVNQEASPILYASNHFAFMDPLAMDVFLERNSANIQYIRRCSLLYWGRCHDLYRRRALDQLIKATNLEEFILQDGCLSSLWGYTTRGEVHASLFYMRAGPWLCSVKERKGSSTAATNLLSLAGNNNTTKGTHILPKFQAKKSHFRKTWAADGSDKYRMDFRQELIRRMDDLDWRRRNQMLGFPVVGHTYYT